MKKDSVKVSLARARFPHVLGRMGKLEVVDRRLFCLAALDFFRQLTDSMHCRSFISTFQSVASPESPYHELLACLTDSGIKCFLLIFFYFIFFFFFTCTAAPFIATFQTLALPDSPYPDLLACLTGSGFTAFIFFSFLLFLLLLLHMHCLSCVATPGGVVLLESPSHDLLACLTDSSVLFFFLFFLLFYFFFFFFSTCAGAPSFQPSRVWHCPSPTATTTWPFSQIQVLLSSSPFSSSSPAPLLLCRHLLDYSVARFSIPQPFDQFDRFRYHCLLLLFLFFWGGGGGGGKGDFFFLLRLLLLLLCLLLLFLLLLLFVLLLPLFPLLLLHFLAGTTRVIVLFLLFLLLLLLPLHSLGWNYEGQCTGEIFTCGTIYPPLK